MKIVLEGGTAEITEKKSRFIAEVRPVRSEEAAAVFLAQTRRKYWDAKHHCSAFVTGEHNEQSRCSDDGEPSGTAGRPMLAVLTGADVHDVCVIVTRYFGGVLLGTGGLVRAYGAAALAALKASRCAEKVCGFRFQIAADYNEIEKVRYLLCQSGCPVTDCEYGADVRIRTVVPADRLESLKREVTDKTAGRALFMNEEAVQYAMEDGAPLFL